MRVIIFHKIFLLTLSFFSILEGKDFGTFGHTFPIKEKSLKEVLQEKAGALSQEEVRRGCENLAEKIKKEETLFKKISHIKEAEHYRSFVYDPSISLEEDILDDKGEALFPKGMKVNPLEGIALDKGLLFFDGNNPKHIEWAESQEGEFKWVLVGGSPLKIQEEKGRPVFFDQGGVYSRKFQIENVPCRITQEKTVLRVEEIPIKRRK